MPVPEPPLPPSPPDAEAKVPKDYQKQYGNGDNGELIGDRVENLAQIAYLIEASGDFAVEKVGQTRKSDDNNRPKNVIGYLIVNKNIGEKRNHEYS